MDEILEDLREKYGDSYWINSHVSKGPIIVNWKNSKPWFIVDVKTPGYPFVGFIGKYVLTGGNWRISEDKTPLDVYKRALSDELAVSVIPTIEPFADYLEFYSFKDHKNKKMKEVLPSGDVYSIVSMFSSTLEGEHLQEELKIPSSDLTISSLQEKISIEGGIAVLTLDELTSGQLDNFAAGDGVKLSDYLHDVYNISVTVKTPRGKSYRLTQTRPLTPYDERDTLPYLRVNPRRTDTRDSQSPFRKV